MNEITIGIDLGGTRIKEVAIDKSGNLLYQDYYSTNDESDLAWKATISAAVSKIKEEISCNCSVVGISAPGLPNSDNSAIAYMPGRLQGLENFDWTKFLKIKTFVLNDAVSAMIAEARLGAARGKRNVVMLTLGTGVGGAILINGKPYQGAFNKAGHIGHMVIDSDGDQDITGMPGSLEEAIGNCSIEKRSLGKFHSTQQLLEAYHKGDYFAAQIWLTSVKKLAIGIASLTNILSPDMIVLGGGITEAGKDLFDPLDQYLSLYEWRAGGNKTEIVKAQYGDMAGAVGAACFAMEQSLNL
ncbi:MAG: ROK family protein [Bacteroidales bacterium]|nr:ROK family protein [Bacteroidales bacterium]